jgi:hypothetical protein
VHRVANAERTTDGRVPDEGAPWRSEETSLARGEAAFVEFDLGAPRRIRAAWMQADHNDRYVLSASSDGRAFVPFWTAEPVRAGGLRTRFAGGLDVTARYVRLAPEEGDRAYSVAEIKLYETEPKSWPPRVRRVQPVPPNAPLRARIAWGALGLGLLVLCTLSRMPAWAFALAAVASAGLLVTAAREAVAAFPLDVQTESAIRAAVAAVAAVCVVCVGTRADRVARWRRMVPAAVLGACAVVAFASFFHFGRAQFYDHARRQASFVHYLDMRVYFTVAKYFRELGFDGLYPASVAALDEMERHTTLDDLGSVEFRDLRNHQVVRVRDVRGHVAEVRARFGARRWAEFVEDMRYFRGAMGRPLYLANMLDHGANATPVWLTHARWIFRDRPASHALLVATGLLDPALLLLGFAALAWSFGLVTAMVCMLVFGACDYPMGGVTNWVGATLRHDWMAALAFAMSALGRRSYAWGGAFLALAASLRAFPAAAFVGILAAAAWSVMDDWRSTGRVPGWARLRQTQAPALRVLMGGAAAFALLVSASVITLGAGAWPAWLHKVALLSSEPRVNHMGVRALFNYDFARDLRAASERGLSFDWVDAQAHAFEGRFAGYYLAVGALTALIVLACRRQPPARAALLGLCLFVVWLYPANYYIHFVFLLPLLADVPRSLRGVALSPAATAIGGASCAMCVAEYAGVIEPYLDRHYFIGSVCLMATLASCVVLASPDLRYFFRAASARALRVARTRAA